MEDTIKISVRRMWCEVFERGIKLAQNRVIFTEK
jgi:hypothetical protein